MGNVLKATDIHKSFGAVKALDGLNLEIAEGEIHCLAGENGCGKSTIIKIISGVYSMDHGKLELGGKTYERITPVEAIEAGVQVIYQDFSIFPNLTVLENIAYNSELAERKRLVNWKHMKKIALEAAAKIDLKVDMDALAGDLSVADKQMIAICRALINNAKLVIMDEPTTALTKREVKALFKIVLGLKAQGIAILFVSHKLDEVFEISDGCTIVRNGKTVFSGNIKLLDEKKFSYYMTGREFEDAPVLQQCDNRDTALKVRNYTLKNAFYDISFELKQGEILGIAGLLGSGRTELALALFGALRVQQGSIQIHGKECRFRNVREAMKAGLGYVPEDRLTEGLFLEQSIGSNIVISKLKEISNRGGIVDRKRRSREIASWVKRLSIATPDAEHAVSTLSGGNQQRVVLAKWLARDPQVLILNGPTVGVDIGSKYDIHNILRDAAAKGIGIIIISDDIPELLANCNRTLVMKSGRIIGEFAHGETTVEGLSRIMTSDRKEEASCSVGQNKC